VLTIPAGNEIVVTARKGYMVGQARLIPSTGKLHELEIKLEQQKGNLLLKIAGAETGKVYFDGKEIGVFGKGLFRDLPAGSHEYSVKGKGFIAGGQVSITPDSTTTVSALLTEVGSFRVSMPDECSVKISAKNFGPVVLSSKKLLEEVPTGEISIEATGPGYDEVKATLIVTRASETAWIPWTTGGLSIEANVPGVLISLNGKNAGLAPLVLNGLAIGKSTITAKADGYEEARESATVTLGKTLPVRLKLARSVGSFKPLVADDVKVTIEGAEIVSQSFTGQKLLQDLPTGEYRVSASGTGYETASDTIRVKRNEETAWTPWKSGTLFIETSPPGAKVFTDGKRIGESPVKLSSLPIAPVAISAKAEGYEDALFTAVVQGGRTVSVPLALKRSMGRLRLDIPGDVNVLVRSAEIGEKSMTGGETVLDLPTGEYRVEAGGAGYEPSSAIVVVGRNAETAWKPWTTGSLLVESEPKGAFVIIGGKEAGRTPLLLSALPLAPITVGAQAEGYEDGTSVATVEGGRITPISLTLARSLGQFRADLPEEAEFSLWSSELGEKKASGKAAALTLPTGQYKITATCPGLQDTSGTITVIRGTEITWMPWTNGFVSCASYPSGAVVLVDGKEQGVTPLLLEVEARKPHRVQLRLAGYEMYSADINVAVGKKSTVFNVLRGLPGSISIETNPPGATVRLDGVYETSKETPAIFEAVEPGQHNLEIQAYLKDKVLYASETVDVNVGLDSKVKVSKVLVRGTATLCVADAPAGSTLFIDGKKIENSAIFGAGIQLPAGQYDALLKWPSGQEWTTPLTLWNKETYTIRPSYMEHVLPRRTIKIDGKMDDWAGLEPVFIGNSYADKLPNAGGSKIEKGYVCRDDKNLYWRMDFADGRPDTDLKVQIHTLTLTSGLYSISLSVRNHPQGREAFIGIYKGSWESNLRTGSFATSKTSMEMRIPFSAFIKYIDSSAATGVMMTHVWSETDWASQSRTQDKTTTQKLIITP
jgi:hypothetical protein